MARQPSRVEISLGGGLNVFEVLKLPYRDKFALVIGGAFAAVFVFVFVYGYVAGGGFAAAFGVGLVAAAPFAIGVLAGFVFGIPRTVPGTSAAPRSTMPGRRSISIPSGEPH